MLGNPKLRKVVSLGTAAIGAFSLLAPKKAAVLGDKLSLAPRYENFSDADLVPREWYVDATRASGAGMLAAGLTGFLLATRDDTAPTTVDADEEPIDDDVDVIESNGDDADDAENEDDDPVEIDLEDADDPSDD